MSRDSGTPWVPGSAANAVQTWTVAAGVNVYSDADLFPLAVRLESRRWKINLFNRTVGQITTLQVRTRNRPGGEWTLWRDYATDDVPCDPVNGEGTAGTITVQNTDALDYEVDLRVTCAAAGTIGVDMVGADR